MPPLSLNKIMTAIMFIVILWHLKSILHYLEPVFVWLSSSLQGLYDFPAGAQTAIAFLTLILIVVLIVKHHN